MGFKRSPQWTWAYDVAVANRIRGDHDEWVSWTAIQC